MISAKHCILSYSLDLKQLLTVSSTKYLGVTMQSNVKLTEHIEAKTNKARQILGMIRRSPHKAFEKIKLLAYLVFVDPFVNMRHLCGILTKESTYKRLFIQNSGIRLISVL